MRKGRTNASKACQEELFKWLDSHRCSDDPVEGFPFGGWSCPEHCNSTLANPDPHDDYISLVQWAWIEEHCPGGCGVDYTTNRIIRSHPRKDADRPSLHVGFYYIWFKDEITATLFRVRFGG